MLDVILILILVLIIAVCLPSVFVRVVRVREALLICDRTTGAFRRIAVGPSVTEMLPFAETAHRIDLGLRMTSVSNAFVVTLDGLPVAIDMDVVWAVDPALLSAADVDLVLPFLADLGEPVKRWMIYAMKTVVGQCNMQTVLEVARRHDGLQRRVLDRLSKGVAGLGVRVDMVRMICQPEATLLNARITGEARARELAALQTALAEKLPLESLLRLEMMESLRANGGQFITAFDLPRGDGGDGRLGNVQFVVGAPRR